MMEPHAARKAAFASWEAYKPEARASYAAVSPTVAAIVGTADSFLDNPLVMLTYADGYLAGRQAARTEAEARQRDLEVRMGPLSDQELESVRADTANIPRDWRLLATIDRDRGTLLAVRDALRQIVWMADAAEPISVHAAEIAAETLEALGDTEFGDG